MLLRHWKLGGLAHLGKNAHQNLVPGVARQVMG